MIKRSICAPLLLAALSAICLPLSAQVKVWQGTLTLPTYQEGQPDPTRLSIFMQPTASTIPTP